MRAVALCYLVVYSPLYGLIDAIVSLPLLNIEIRILWSLLETLVVARLGSDFPRDEWCELQSVKYVQKFALFGHVDISYLEVFQVGGHGVCAHFVPFDDVSSVLVVSTH